MKPELVSLLTREKPFVSTCTAAALRLFGLESLEWDPLVLRDSLQDALKLQKCPQKLFDKINCGYTMIGTNGYTARLEAFVTCNSVMSSIAFDEGVMGIDDQYSLSWGVWEYFRLTGDTLESTQFNIDTAIYSGEILYRAGITAPPDWLSWVEYDPEKIARLDTLLDDPQFYMDRQRGMNIELENYCREKDAQMVNQLQRLDVLLPAKEDQ